MREEQVMKKVLIADDKPEVVELVRVTLEGEDYQVIDAFDGEEALRKTTKEKPDLIILDVVMPKMDGYEVLGNIKKDPKTKDIPVIMLSAKGQKLDREKGMKLGAIDYIVKPFSPSDLLGKLEKILA